MQYTVPSFYLNTDLAVKLDRLFPDRRCAIHMARYVLLPSNVVWERIVRTHEAYLRHARYKVGLQVRTYSSYEKEVDEVGQSGGELVQGTGVLTSCLRILSGT